MSSPEVDQVESETRGGSQLENTGLWKTQGSASLYGRQSTCTAPNTRTHRVRQYFVPHASSGLPREGSPTPKCVSIGVR
ncbi:MAG: hypothetical protein ACON5J_18455 [Rubripirellula sp.]